MRRLRPVIAVLCLILAGCGSDGDDERAATTTATATTPPAISTDLPQGDEPVKLDPAEFTTKIDNPYWPMPKGARWVYLSDAERIVVEVTERRKEIAGVEALVLRDTVTRRGGGGF